MITLAEQIREFIDTLNELGPTDVSAGHMKQVAFKNPGHIVPGTPEAVIGEHIVDFVDGMMFKMKGMLNLEEEKRQEIMFELEELVQFAKDKL